MKNKIEPPHPHLLRTVWEPALWLCVWIGALSWAYTSSSWVPIVLGSQLAMAAVLVALYFWLKSKYVRANIQTSKSTFVINFVAVAILVYVNRTSLAVRLEQIVFFFGIVRLIQIYTGAIQAKVRLKQRKV